MITCLTASQPNTSHLTIPSPPTYTGVLRAPHTRHQRRCILFHLPQGATAGVRRGAPPALTLQRAGGDGQGRGARGPGRPHLRLHPPHHDGGAVSGHGLDGLSWVAVAHHSDAGGGYQVSAYVRWSGDGGVVGGEESSNGLTPLFIHPPFTLTFPSYPHSSIHSTAP